MKYYIKDTPDNLFAYEDNDTNIPQGLISFNAEMQENGLPYSDYLEADENGFYAKDDEKLQEKATLKMIADGEKLVEDYIQVEVAKFNEANGTKFTDVHAMANYMNSETYPYATACKAIWDWNELVWVAARGAQEQAVIDGLSAEEFLILLPEYGE